MPNDELIENLNATADFLAEQAEECADGSEASLLLKSAAAHLVDAIAAIEQESLN